jgi:hypothetical protein
MGKEKIAKTLDKGSVGELEQVIEGLNEIIA